MIRHTATHRADHIADAVGCARVFGSVFVLTGSLSLWAAVTGAAGLAEAGLWSRLGLAVIGVGHLGGGLSLWLWRQSEATVRRRGVEWVERRPFRPVRTRTFAPSEVDAVRVETSHDSDGDAVFRVVLDLESGERLPLTQQSSPSAEVVEDAAAAVARRLGMADRVG